MGFGPEKNLLVRVTAHSIGARFLKIAAPELGQTNIGSRAAYVRELFKLAREYASTIIFIDKIDTIGGKSSNDDSSNKEVPEHC